MLSPIQQKKAQNNSEEIIMAVGKEGLSGSNSLKKTFWSAWRFS